MNRYNHPFMEPFNQVKPNNMAGRAQVETRVKFLLEDMFKSFPGGRASHAQLWVSRLMDLSFSYDEIKIAVEFTVNNLEKCPSFAQFKNIVFNENEKPDEKEEQELKINAQFNAEIKSYHEKRREIVKVIGEDGLDAFFRKVYIPRLYPALQEHSKKLGIPLKTFERLAVLDLFRANLNPERSIEIARATK
jgi:hypothetical protein